MDHVAFCQVCGAPGARELLRDGERSLSLPDLLLQVWTTAKTPAIISARAEQMSLARLVDAFTAMLLPSSLCAEHAIEDKLVRRKSVWKRLREAAVDSMRPLFRPVQSSEACACLQARTLGITRLRFLPKRSGKPLKLPLLHSDLSSVHIAFACLNSAVRSAVRLRKPLHVRSSARRETSNTRTGERHGDRRVWGADGLHDLQACGRLPTWAVRLLSTSRVLG